MGLAVANSCGSCAHETPEIVLPLLDVSQTIVFQQVGTNDKGPLWTTDRGHLEWNQ